MSDDSPEPTAADPLAEIGHPKGTLAVLAIYMLLFILGWAALYFGQFLPRGTPDSTPDQTGIYSEAPGEGSTP